MTAVAGVDVGGDHVFLGGRLGIDAEATSIDTFGCACRRCRRRQRRCVIFLLVFQMILQSSFAHAEMLGDDLVVPRYFGKD